MSLEKEEHRKLLDKMEKVNNDLDRLTCRNIELESPRVSRGADPVNHIREQAKGLYQYVISVAHHASPLTSTQANKKLGPESSVGGGLVAAQILITRIYDSTRESPAPLAPPRHRRMSGSGFYSQPGIFQGLPHGNGARRRSNP